MKSHMVALLAEGVDRNLATFFHLYHAMVALLAEGVDRNTTADGVCALAARSPSSRRAWIEMEQTLSRSKPKEVALLAEGVDRNY